MIEITSSKYGVRGRFASVAEAQRAIREPLATLTVCGAYVADQDGEFVGIVLCRAVVTDSFGDLPTHTTKWYATPNLAQWYGIELITRLSGGYSQQAARWQVVVERGQ